MNGAENLLATLLDAGVEVCFANPGTSEMHLVAAIGRSERMRAVLCLFEGVASGAADGYARMTDRPAATLLHLGSGYANSMANQHNAMRARVPLVNLVGEHATWHLQHDAPLTSDIAAHARISSGFVRTSTSADDLARTGAEAVAASFQGAGRIATAIVPANHAWESAQASVAALPRPALPGFERAAVDRVAAALRSGEPAALLLGGRALRSRGLEAAGRIARATGARLWCETFPARVQRGVGRVHVDRLPYFAEEATAALASCHVLVLAGAAAPVSFFAYPGKPSWLAPQGCSVETLASADEDPEGALAALAEALGAHEPAELVGALPPQTSPEGVLTPVALARSVAALLPDQAIVADESNTCGMALYPLTAQAAPHDWLGLTGGAIGIGLPLALGAAIACPERKVVALEADGSAMYTVQALWTMARERTDVTIVILNNRSYAILNVELARVGAGHPTPKTLGMLGLRQPDIDWVAVASGLGVPATRATTAEEFHAQFAAAMNRKGPQLIDALVVQQMPG